MPLTGLAWIKYLIEGLLFIEERSVKKEDFQRTYIYRTPCGVFYSLKRVSKKASDKRSYQGSSPATRCSVKEDL